MKYLPFKQIMLSLLLPVILYVWSVPLCERSVAGYHQANMKQGLLQSEKSLWDGEAAVKEVVRDNLTRYVTGHLSFALFSSRTITVRTGFGELVYPVTDTPSSPLDDRQVVATENYRLLQEGLVVDVEFFTGPTAPLSVMALLVFSALAMGALYRVYRKQVVYISAEQQERDCAIASLRAGERAAEKQLEVLGGRQEALRRSLEKARKELIESTESQTEMVEEIEVLESLVEENETQLTEQKSEIRQLTQKIEAHRPVKEKKAGKRAHREREITARRLTTLYKNLRVHERAVQGFLALDEGMRLKCEEVIHQLNGDPGGVSVKRKVFGGKGLDTFLETEFAYKGRIYFLRLPGGKVEVVAIGTKNSQATELGFLHRISGETKTA
ncbi:hypothetical protein [Desulfoluna spongiiphila]|uniref:hypothetical protein n=1 Tax=Desulfoluna spongiiphila TaxID=419481 RepID=UPI0012549677|nr:hypothetical protein [Desulfoluna spongiiphila]VVS94020.1 hypothetical protein DBB_35920 [Desulfoluna spongiiphila]